MGAVNFTLGEISAFISGVGKVKDKLRFETEQAEYAKSYCESQINEQIDRGEACIWEIQQDYNLAQSIYYRNESKIEKLSRERSALGAGDDKAAERQSIQSQINEIERNDRQLHTAISKLRSLRDGIQERIDKLKRVKDTIIERYVKIREFSKKAENELNEVIKQAERAIEYGRGIIKELKLGDVQKIDESERICFIDTSVVGKFSIATANVRTEMTEKEKAQNKAAYTMGQMLSAEISRVAVSGSSQMCGESEKFCVFLQKVSVSFSRASKYLSGYESLA